MNTSAIITALTAGVLALAVAGEQPSKFKVTTRRRSDTVNIMTDKDKVVFVVKSPSGISEAFIERSDETWPKVVVLRLHLKGLESFHLANGRVTLDAAVSIREGKPNVRQWKDGKEDAPLDEKHPFWVDIRKAVTMLQDLPPKESYFEVTLPRAFFESNPKTISVQWLDFFRG